MSRRYRGRRRGRRVGLISATIFGALLIGAGVIATSPLFADLKREATVLAVRYFLDWTVVIDGNVEIDLAEPIRIRANDVRISLSLDPREHENIPLKYVELAFPVWGVLTASFDISGLVLAGASFDLTDDVASGDPEEATPSRFGPPRFLSTFLNAGVSENVELRDFTLSYGDVAAGWQFEWRVDRFTSLRSADGGNIEMTFNGSLNGLPLTATGKFPNPRADSSETETAAFAIDSSLASLSARFAGDIDVSKPVTTVDGQLTANAGAYEDILKAFRITHEDDGTGKLSARLSGPLDALRLADLDFLIGDAAGRTLTLTGKIEDLGAVTGIDVAFAAALHDKPVTQGRGAAVFDFDITGVHGQISGSYDELKVDRVFVETSIASTELNNVGPISLGKIVRDTDGRLGFIGFRIIEGAANDPKIDISGSIADVLGFSGVDLSGQFNISMAAILMEKPDAQSGDLGRLKGRLAASDALGKLHLTRFDAGITGTDLIVFTIKRTDAGDIGTFAIDLDIADFDPIARRLGRPAEVGAVGFTGTFLAGRNGPELTGDGRVGQTRFAIATEGRIHEGGPYISVRLSSDLLDLGDVQRAVQVYRVYSVTDSQGIDVDLDENFVEETRLDLEVDVRKIHGVGDEVGDIHAKGHYERGIATLNPVQLNFLEGAVDARVRADTNRKPTALTASGTIEKLDLGRFLTSLGETPFVTGTLDTNFDVSGSAGSLGEMLASVDGTVDADIRGGVLASSLIELGGQNVVAWMFSRSAATGEAELVCAVATLEFAKGKANAKPVVIETKNVQVFGGGAIDIPADRIDMSFQTRPKRHELVDVATAFTVEGNLSKPDIRLVSGGGARRVAGEVLTAPLNILGLLLPDGDTDPKHKPCVVDTAAPE